MIKSLRERGVSYKDIVEFLRTHYTPPIEVSEGYLRAFCKEELGEKPKRRKKIKAEQEVESAHPVNSFWDEELEGLEDFPGVDASKVPEGEEEDSGHSQGAQATANEIE